MEKHTYQEPLTKMLCASEEAILAGTYKKIDEADEGEDLAREGLFDEESWPKMQSLWD